jgi:methionyl-tRNA formyltransferase
VGVTIHLMSPQLDKGDILAQAPLPLPDGASGQELDAHAAQVGGQQLGHVLDTLYRGIATPYPQPEGGSYQSWPTQKDFIVPTSWRALHAWNFMQAAAEWHTPFTIQALGQKQPLTVERALEFNPSASLNAPLLYQKDSIAVQFTPGIVWVS